jgi:hypothetical protein
MGMTLPKLTKKAQDVFNAYIRRRDEGQPCISCGEYKKLQAGHYVAVKKGSFLRFHEDNVNGECLHCNYYNPSHLVWYRMNLVKKIGVERVEWLEANCRNVKKWSRAELEEIIQKYK